MECSYIYFYEAIHIKNIMTMVDRTIIAHDAPYEHLSEYAEIVPVTFFQKRENTNNLENKVLHLKILGCTMGGSNIAARVNSSTQYGPKRHKPMQTNRIYNRYFLCADLSNPPYCAAIMTKNTTESAQLLRHTHGGIFVGPLKPNCSNIDTSDKMKLPSQAGETNYFTLVGKPVKLHRISVPTDVSCPGIQCDRQKGKGECSCIHNGPGTAFVYSFDVEFDVPSRLGYGNTYTSHGFRSFRTTSLFFKDMNKYANSTTIDDETTILQQNRPLISQMVDYVNQNDGWTLVGWFKLGEVTDAANQQEKVENSEITVRISYLFPTNDNIIKTNEFQELQID
jgi:hypothetical protein